jgi:CheY-like chemotaxis protein/ribosomal protein S27AE
MMHDGTPDRRVRGHGMEIRCPRCGRLALPAGHEDARAFYQCETCKRVWMTFLSAPAPVRRVRAGGTVLVVDDSNELVGLVSAWLEDEGYDAVVATTGAAALDACESHRPDVVLLDLVMSPLDGLAIYEKLRVRAHPEVVLMTGVADPERMRRVADIAGNLVVLHKPFARETVLAAVRAALARRAGALNGSASPA